MYLSGKANIHFTTFGIASTTQLIVIEKYLEEEIFYFGSKNGPTLTLPVVVRSFRFEQTLPPILPQSMEGLYGSIKYEVGVELIRPWKFNLRKSLPFEVVHRLNLNLYPQFNQPMEIVRTHFSAFDCIAPKPLTMKVRLSKTGLAVGETNNVYFELINQSSTKIISTRLKILKIDTFGNFKSSKSEVLKYTVSSWCFPGVNINSEASFNAEFKIPEDLQNSSLLQRRLAYDSTYVLYITANSFWGTVCEVKIPIVIGTVGY